MSHVTSSQPRRASRSGADASQPHLGAGTIIYTLDGALPVEYLEPGDRIITRAGARILRALHRLGAGLEQRFVLQFDAPEVIYADGAEVACA